MAKKVKKAQKAQEQWYPIAVGQSKNFLYVGNLIPNQVNVMNTGTTPTEFTLTSRPAGWDYYGRVLGNSQGNRQTALMVKFPNGKMTFHNVGPRKIEISGHFLRPD